MPEGQGPLAQFASSLFLLHQLSNRFGNFVGRWDGRAFEFVVVGHWRIHGAKAFDRGIEPIETFIRDDRRDFGAKAADGPGFVDVRHAIGFPTVFRIVSSSSGFNVRGLITSTLIPSRSGVRAAERARGTIAMVATTVTSVPSRFTSALPMGMA